MGKEFSAPGVRVGLLQEEEAGCTKVLSREEPGTFKEPKGNLVWLGHTEEGEETGGAAWRGIRQSLEGCAKGVSLCLAQKQRKHLKRATCGTQFVTRPLVHAGVRSGAGQPRPVSSGQTCARNRVRMTSAEVQGPLQRRGRASMWLRPWKLPAVDTGSPLMARMKGAGVTAGLRQLSRQESLVTRVLASEKQMHSDRY